MKRLSAAALLAACALAVPAFAKGLPTAQNHQCMKDGQVIQKTKKECAKEGGKWEKMAATTPAPADAKPAMKPADTKAPEAKPMPKPVETKPTDMKAVDPKM